jgi:hypothetical protein
MKQGGIVVKPEVSSEPTNIDFLHEAKVNALKNPMDRIN